MTNQDAIINQFEIQEQKRILQNLKTKIYQKTNFINLLNYQNFFFTNNEKKEAENLIFDLEICKKSVGAKFTKSLNY